MGGDEGWEADDGGITEPGGDFRRGSKYDGKGGSHVKWFSLENIPVGQE